MREALITQKIRYQKMPDILGIDTSNYTTSCAVLNTESMVVWQTKKLLPVKNGELGLRQSDAVFNHTVQLPQIITQLKENKSFSPEAIGVSAKPRNSEGSYMPCFLVGKGTAECIGAVLNKDVFETSHQVGHILSALFSCSKLNLIKKRFIAFHVSGGTTDCLLVTPSDEEVISCSEIGTSMDLKAGQAVDRVGLMLGLSFPCGKELEKLALKSIRNFTVKPVIRENNCSLSGVENKCRKMLLEGESPQDIALFCLKYIEVSVLAMTEAARNKFGDIPVIYAGGVMSNSIIRSSILKKISGSSFAEPDFSCDNAVGTAVFAAIKKGLI